jgi:hypothetical protein
MTTGSFGDRIIQRCWTIALPVALALLGSCSVFIPSHSNSYKHEGERVEITMNKARFVAGKSAKEIAELKTTAAGPELAAAAGAALAGLAIDQIGKAIEEEAEKLEAQHGQRVAEQNFWTLHTRPLTLQEAWASKDGMLWLRDFQSDDKGDVTLVKTQMVNVGAGNTANTMLHNWPADLVPENSAVAATAFDAAKMASKLELQGTYVTDPNFTYSGFTYRRWVGNEIAFELTCDFHRSDDRSVFLVAPTRVMLTSSKAKVLDFSYCPLHAWSWFADVGDEVEVDIHIAIDALWIDEKQKPHMQAIGAFDLTKLRFDLTNPARWNEEEKTWEGAVWSGSEKQARGWFPSVPRSHIAGGKEPTGTGTFWIEVQVTERDPSSGKNRIERAAKLVRDNRDDLVDAVRDLGKRSQ